MGHPYFALEFLSWFALFYLFLGLGGTLGYHRMLTHRALKVPKWLMYLITTGGYLSFQGPPLVWVAIHRTHHQRSDQTGDPHSPKQGFIHALYGWAFGVVEPDEQLHKQVPDLIKDPYFRLLGDKNGPGGMVRCVIVGLTFRLLVLALFGWVAFAAIMAASIFPFLAGMLVNSICHMPKMGYRLWNTKEMSTNVWWVGYWSLGEGWHNTHHYMPRSARHGIRWWEFDATWCAIWLLEKLGLATDVIRPSALIADPDQEAPVEMAISV